MQKDTNTSLILYLISLVLMGSNGIVASFIHLTSIEIVFMRTSIGSIVLILACILNESKFECLKDKSEAMHLILSGFALGLGWIFLFEAYKLIGVSISTLLYYLGPVIAMVLSPIFFKEKLTKYKIIGATIVFIGIILLNGNIKETTIDIRGIFYGFMSGLLYAVMVILNKKVKIASGIENATCQVVSSFILIVIFMLCTTGINIKIEGKEWIPAIWIGLVNTGLVCYLYYSTITKLPMSTVAIFSYLDPVSAIVMSVLFLGERFTLIQIIAAFMVIGGAAFSQGRGRETIN